MCLRLLGASQLLAMDDMSRNFRSTDASFLDEIQIRQGIDAGVGLERIAASFPDIEAAVDFYITHLRQRFSASQSGVAVTPIEWRLIYQTRRRKFINLLLVFAMLGGIHFQLSVRERTFTTFHFLSPSEVRILKLKLHLAECLRYFLFFFLIVFGGITFGLGVLAALWIFSGNGFFSDFLPYFCLGSFISLLAVAAYLRTFTFPIPAEARLLAKSNVVPKKVGV